jgi:hypothetical protein
MDELTIQLGYNGYRVSKFNGEWDCIWFDLRPSDAALWVCELNNYLWNDD